MHYKYVENLLAKGRPCFTAEEMRRELSISEDAARSGVYRLKKENKVISPLNGLYIIVPPEHRPYGSIPAEELIPIMMKYLNADYYVGLLSGATYFGATHQKPAKFQIVTNQRIKHSLQFGQIAIELIYRKSLASLPIQKFSVKTGYLNVASPELIALDLFKYHSRSGGVSHIATVLSEVVEKVDVQKLIGLAERLGEQAQLQRIGYVVEKLELIDEAQKEHFVFTLVKYLEQISRPYVPLVPSLAKSGAIRANKWKVVENSDFESDL